ncbi:hypothetical protein [Arthrobacter globiformis]|uniref:Nuclear transport factor 2 family protein n=1 Tax=Arthrobacter globiformis TaxID=1665 RepID=A0A328HC05_ARTGO|nr:hypothetical protein [Arthrobacter globiformis]RAM35694.1 hypothetical protein DBZ45_18900 [Arthrobacter globiformis]
MTAPPRPDRTLIVVLVIIAGLVAVALAVVFFRGEPEPLAENTPAGVVQRYAAAVLNNDAAAAARFTTDGRSGQPDRPCVPADRPETGTLRVTLASTVEHADTADVHAVLATSYGNGPFGNSEYETEAVFNLERVNGNWLVATAPWQLTICPVPAAKP